MCKIPDDLESREVQMPLSDRAVAAKSDYQGSVVMEGWLRKGNSTVKVNKDKPCKDLSYYRLVMYPQQMEPAVVLESYGKTRPVQGGAAEEVVELWTSKLHSKIRWQEPTEEMEEMANTTIAFKVYKTNNTMLSLTSVHLEAETPEMCERWVEALQITIPERAPPITDKPASRSWRAWLSDPFASTNPKTQPHNRAKVDGEEMQTVGAAEVNTSGSPLVKTETKGSIVSATTFEAGMLVAGAAVVVVVPAAAGIVAATHPALVAATGSAIGGAVRSVGMALAPPYYY